jgi:hypothetical protein
MGGRLLFKVDGFKFSVKLTDRQAECWCLMPVILATQEAEIRRTEVLLLLMGLG